MFEIQAVAGEKKQGDFERYVSADPLSSDALRSDLAEINDMLVLLSSSRLGIHRLVESPGAMDLYAKMVRGGISETNAQRFMKQGGVLEGDRRTDPDILYEQVLTKILEVIEVKELFADRHEQVVAALVGERAARAPHDELTPVALIVGAATPTVRPELAAAVRDIGDPRRDPQGVEFRVDGDGIDVALVAPAIAVSQDVDLGRT